MPPEKVTVILPSSVLQSGLVEVEPVVTAALGWVIVVVAGAVHALESLTVTVCDPVARLLNVAGEVQELKAAPSRLQV